MIKIQELVIDGFTAKDIHRLVTLTNIEIMKVVESIVCDINKENLQHYITSSLSYFVTGLHATYDRQTIVDILNDLDEDSTTIVEECGTDPMLPRTIAYDIGTNSEMTQNYSAAELIVLILAIAKKYEMKFDFSWNL